MKAKKENKVYTITEQEKASYLTRGFDIYDDKDNLVERSHKSTVSYADYQKLQEENKKLKVEIAKLKKDGEK